MAWAKVTAGSDKAVGVFAGPLLWVTDDSVGYGMMQVTPGELEQLRKGDEQRGVPTHYCGTGVGVRFWPAAAEDGEIWGLVAPAAVAPIVGRASVGDMTWEVTCLGGTPDAEFQVRMALAAAICPEHFGKGGL